MSSYHKNSDGTIAKVNKAYDSAIKDINEDIRNIVYNFKINGDLSNTEVRKLLNSKIPNPMIKLFKRVIPKIKDEDIKKWLLSRVNAKAYKARITRLEALKESIYINTRQIADVELYESNLGYVNNIKKAYYSNIYDIQKGTGLAFSFTTMPVATIDEILKQNWSGKHYSDRVWSNVDVLAENLEEVITSGLMQGKSSKKMAAELADLSTMGKMAAERLVRTETTYITNQSELKSYKECEIEKYVFVATLDLRTSATCRKHDGKVYEVSKGMPGSNLPPLHPWCRSTTIAYFGEDTLKNLRRRARDPQTGQTYVLPSNMNYNDWYQKYVVDKYGPQKAETFEKMIKNKASDKKQFDNYKEVLGKDAPKSFDKFRDLKYNNTKEWNGLKRSYTDTNRYNKIVDSASNLNIKGIPIKNIDRIDLKEYEFDYHHINNEREHGVTKEMAQEFINNSRAAYSRWNGQVVVYISENGCSVVNLKDKKVSTSYKSDEYDDKFKKLMEALKYD